MHDNVAPLFKKETLAELEAKIDRELAIEGTNALESAIRIGEWLTRIKTKHLKHGQFGPWLKDHFKREKMQASRYMNAAENADALRAKVSSGDTFHLNSFYKLLPPKPRREPRLKKDGTPRSKSTTGRAATREDTAKEKLAFAAYDRQFAAGEDITRESVAREAGVSNTIADKVIAMRRVAPLQLLPDVETLTGKKLIEAHIRKLDREFEQKVSAAAKAYSENWLATYRIPEYEKRFAQVVTLLSRAKSLITREELAVWRKCLHPNAVDINGVHMHRDLLNGAFDTLKRVQDALVIPSDMRDRTMKDTRTPAEIMADLLARRAQKL